MKRPSALAAGLKAIAAARPATPTPMTAAAPAERPRRAIGKGTVLIGGHFAPRVRRTLLLIQAEQANEGKNLKQLLGEAINLLADKYGKPRPYEGEG
ncbi:MAG: ribbon-helix-helix domain-containing protein [Candidatus Dormibacteria bacterium]